MDFDEKLFPVFHCPDQNIEQIFRFRAEAFFGHIIQRANGTYVVTEFSAPVAHSGVDGTVSCPAHHHINEGRWIKERKYIRDYLTFWLSKEAEPRLYSFALADSCLNYLLVSGENDLLEKLFDGMAENYAAWEKERFDCDYGLFWQIPDRDGMEFALLALAYGNSHGGEGYRSTINSYMYADAVALSQMAEMLGRKSEAGHFRIKADELRKNFLWKIWNKKRSFFVDRRRDNRFFLDGIELQGYIPWCYNIPENEHCSAWKYITDEEFFCGRYGLRTVEKNHKEYLVEHGLPGRCMWNGWSWPFASSQALTAMANVLNNYQQKFVSAEDYFRLLKIYTMSHYKDGMPYLAEAYEPDEGYWYVDRGARSKNYNHSSYCDLIITGLAGLRPAPEQKVIINPLVPESWEFFSLENVSFCGFELSLFFSHDKGVTFLVDGKETALKRDGKGNLFWQRADHDKIGAIL